MSIPKLIDLIIEIKKLSLIGGVIVKSEGQVLLVRRSETAGKYPNFWAVPMGHIEKGETFKEGAHREFQEETNNSTSNNCNDFEFDEIKKLRKEINKLKQKNIIRFFCVDKNLILFYYILGYNLFIRPIFPFFS